MAVRPDGRRPPGLRLERELVRAGCHAIAGVDEVGRGAWAGPVTAAAVVLPLHLPRLARQLAGVRDSKVMSAVQRQRWEERVRALAEVALGWASPQEVDQLGLIAATRAAMRRAIEALGRPLDHLLIDFVRLPDLAVPQTCLPFGDRRSLSIAAASVVAKVARDERMVAAETDFPGYGFARHKGYGTPGHRRALLKLGPSPIHRFSYRPVRSPPLPGMENEARAKR